MKLSCVIPAHNEEECIRQTVEEIIAGLRDANIVFEIILVDDNSTDSTPQITEDLERSYPEIVVVHRAPPAGFGRAIREGLDRVTGDVVTTVMGDMSDDPKDIVRYFRAIEKGSDCVFGSRFIGGSVVKDYPPLKLFINRLANTFVRALFLRKENDITNAFKMYRREVIESCKPFLALYFNITVEIPLKAINRGFSITQIPIHWYGRKSGVSKLKIRQMGKKYLFTVLYLWLERLLLTDEIRGTRKQRKRIL